LPAEGSAEWPGGASPPGPEHSAASDSFTGGYTSKARFEDVRQVEEELDRIRGEVFGALR
jgi:hypothetical protein